MAYWNDMFFETYQYTCPKCMKSYVLPHISDFIDFWEGDTDWPNKDYKVCQWSVSA